MELAVILYALGALAAVGAGAAGMYLWLTSPSHQHRQQVKRRVRVSVPGSLNGG